MIRSIPVLFSLGLVVAYITNHVAIFLEIHFAPFFSIKYGQIIIKQLVVKLSFAMIDPLKNLSWTFKIFNCNINYSCFGNNRMIVNHHMKPRQVILFRIIINIIYVKCTTINCSWIKTPLKHELRHHKYPYYFTKAGRCMS